MAGGIVLLGASGTTGRLVAAALAHAGLPFVAGGRDVARVRAALGSNTPVDVVRCDVTSADDLAAVTAGATVVVTAVGPFLALGAPVVAACVAAGCAYVDTAGEQPFLADVLSRDAEARANAATLLPGGGHDLVLGDLLAAVAAAAVREVDTPAEVHVAYLTGTERGGRRGLGGLSPGTRASIAAMVGAPARALVRGAYRDEVVAEARRLAWFPRPVGPAHAVGVPGGAALTVPRHVPEAHTVRSYLARPTWQAELLQAASNAARWGPARDALAALVRGRGAPLPPRRRVGTRWALVAEVAGAEGALARAWAYGRDPYAATATTVAVLAGRLARPARPVGALAPAQVDAPSALLDALARAGDLRWALRRPDDRDDGPGGTAAGPVRH